jgi:hypothetical protein
VNGGGPGRRGAAGALRRRATALAVTAALAAVAAGCTPAQFQAWWTAQGHAPLTEPALSEAAAAATRHWEEIARKERFTWSVRRIDGALAARMTPTSWRTGCPVPLADLRYVRVSHMGMDGSERVGELVLHHDVAHYVVLAFKTMWDERFPIRQVRLVDDYGGDDDASMAANNSSAFNCRRVSGTLSWSQHAYGRAVDLNPVQNPYVSGSSVSPAAGRAYLDRSLDRPGMVLRGGPAHRGFTSIGWGWGGSWSATKDYQHFSANGR